MRETVRDRRFVNSSSISTVNGRNRYSTRLSSLVSILKSPEEKETDGHSNSSKENVMRPPDC